MANEIGRSGSRDRDAGDTGSHNKREKGATTTTVVAIVVLLLVAVVAFMIIFWNGGEAEPPAAGPDVELQVDPPEEGGANGIGGDSDQENP